ncbi:MAG: Ppx/GppA family phosphatase [Acidimicrobiia bacterium]|nr:Ppx/GppA family phosphatase [Acidimicrobiia bacterium]
MGETLAALDIGTNSFHLVVARFADGTTNFEVIAREKEMVRLGSGSGDMKDLEDDAIDRGIEALTRFRRVAEIHDASLYAVATSAVREAENADVFLRRASDEAGVEIEVISGMEEARLIHLGVLQAVPVYDRRLLLVDIGGGSTELLVGEQGATLASGSFKLGALRLTRRFFRTESLHPSAVDSCRRFVRSALSPMTREVQHHGFEVGVGSSGTISAIVAMAHARRGDEAPRTFNNAVLTRKEVKAVVRDLIAADSIEARRRLPGVDPSRADILLAGGIILEQVMGEMGMAELVYSDYALREGALLDALERRRGAHLHHLRDLRRHSVTHLGGLMDEDPTHSATVAALALVLFDELASLHELGDDARELLEAAALLANVGIFVSHSGHHKHSYYLIRHSEHLTGFTDREIELIAQVARYHRKSAPKASHPEFAALRPTDQRLVRTLAGLLRVAIGLDRSHEARVAGVTAHLRRSSVTLEVQPRDGADLQMELYSANERKGLLEEMLDRRVRVRQAAAVAAESA